MSFRACKSPSRAVNRRLEAGGRLEVPESGGRADLAGGRGRVCAQVGQIKRRPISGADAGRTPT